MKRGDSISSTSISAVVAVLVSLSPGLVPQAVLARDLDCDAIRRSGIANLEVLNGGLVRGAAPGWRDLEVLSDSGVKTIVDLRLTGVATFAEARQAKKLGIDYYHIPFGFMKPNRANLERVLAIIADPGHQPVFVHCRQGADRTGMVIGMYRRIVDKWDFQPVYEEMRRHHFKAWLKPLKQTVRTCRSEDWSLTRLQTASTEEVAAEKLH